MKQTGSETGRKIKRDAAVMAGRYGRQRLVWGFVAALLVVAGSVGAVVAASAQSGRDGDKARQQLKKSSAEIASTLQLALQREEDLIVSAGGFLAGNPRTSTSQFASWADSVRAMQRYPELRTIGAASLVRSSQLAAFAAAAVRDPVSPLPSDGRFKVVPPGSRPFYCLPVGFKLRSGVAPFPAGHDFCAPGTVVGASARGARDSGTSAYVPIPATSKATTLFSVQSPVYRGGVIPSTVTGRRAALMGFVGMSIDPGVVLNRALQGHPEAAVAFHYERGASNVVFRAGQVPSDRQSTVIDLRNGWSVRVATALPATGVFDDGNARMLLLAGIALSVLIGLLVYLLGTGRARALRLVGVKTGELQHQALHDGLTGLPNRVLVLDRIEQLLARNRRSETTGAVLFVDLDEFKNVNDSLGHGAGDRLLIAISERLKSTLRDADTIGRMGGDEFVVLIDGASLNVAPELVAERLLAVMRQPFDLDETSMPLIVNTSIGIAMGDRPTAGELLRDADVALYQAKAKGKNRYEVFYPEMQTEISQRIELEFDLRSALEEDQFRLVYQPIYNLDQLTIVGVEALLRWDHPARGLVGPEEFIPVLEQTGQIREVGGWVLDRACRQMADWHARGDTLDLSVNVSGRQLDDDAIVGQVRHALDTSGLPAASLIVEVTETALMRNADETAKRLHAIKALGIRIAVDDFGTGYSSLAYLQQFPVDCLKIDQTFTNAISASPESKALIGTLVQLGKDLGLTTLAEGLETTSQMDHLRGENVNEAQGFLLSGPLDPDTLEKRLLAPTRPQHPAPAGPDAN
ncbi:MAG TPA: EAL domain-containing protein [Solirubrobacteraceae bacterium]|nr:EAL domain-containing protein [Solirubrobacteraceae bacterium]